MDLAQLGIKVTYQDPQKAKEKLDAISTSTERAEKSINSLNQKTKRATDGISNSHKKASDQVVNSLGAMEASFASITRRIKQFASFMIAAFAVQTFIRGITGAISVIVEFDQALKSLQAIAGATALEAKVLGDSIKKIASDTKFSAGEVAEGMQTIGKAGFTAGEALKMIQGVSNLATGALEDFNTVASLVVTAVRAFGLEVVQTGEITDVFANAITKSKLSVEGLITAFGYVGAAGSQAGLTLSEVSGSLMVLADNGIRASTMGTALRKTLLSMIAPNEALKSALYSVGMSVKDINPGMVGYEQALRNIAPLVWDFERNTVDMAKAQEFFGIRASQVAAILIRETAQGGGISRAIESTRELGAALKMAEKQQEGLGVKFKNLADTVKNVALAVGEAGLTNVLHTLVDRLKAVASWLENIVKSFPIVQMAGYVAAILAISGAVYGLIKALGIVKTAIFAFNAGLLTTPLGLFITGATAAAGIAAYFSNKLEDTSEAFKKSSIIIDENVSTLEGWMRVLDDAAKKGLADYNAAIVRFVSENKELSAAVIQNINDQKLLEGQAVSTMDQVFLLAGTFENYTAVVKKASENVWVEKQSESINELTKQAELFSKAYKKIQEEMRRSSVILSAPEFVSDAMQTLLQEQINKSAQDLEVPAAKLEAIGTDIANHIFNMYKLKENGAKFATEYIAQMKKATDLPEAFWTALEAQTTAQFTNLGKAAGKANLAALKEIFASIPKEIKDLEKTIPTVNIVDYEAEKKGLQDTLSEMFVLTQESQLFKDSGKSVDELKEALIKLQTEALEKLIIGFGEVKEEALDMSKAFERLKKTVADQEELKALELKVQKIKELGSVKKAELAMEELAQEALINSLNLGPKEAKLYKELIAFIKERTKAEEELEKQIEDDKALKERALALTQEIVLLQDYLRNLEAGMPIKEADNALERKRAELSMINQGLDEDQIRKLLDLKKAIEDKKNATAEDIKELKKQQDAYDDFADTIQEGTADILRDWDNAWDSMIAIMKNALIEMAAAAISNRIVIPIAMQMGSAMGMSWQGTSFQDMSQAQQAGMGMPSGSALTWAGKNIPGMGALGSAMAYQLPGSGLGTLGAVGGTSLGAGLGYGAMGGLGYTMLGGAIGLPQGEYSGLTAGLGGMLGGSYMGSAMGSLGMGSLGASLGSVVPVIGTVIGALLGGLIGSLGGSEKEPKVRVLSGQWGEGHGQPGELNSDFGYRTWIQDVEGSGNRSEIGNAMMQVFDAQFQAIEDATSWGLKEALAGTSFFMSTAKFKDYDNDLEKAFTAMSDDVFRQINQSLVSAMGLSSVGLDTSFFEGLRADGETLLQTFARFATIAESIDDFSGRMDQQMSSGKTAEQAFGNLVVIAETLQAVTSATDAIGTSSGINNVRNMIQAQSDYMNALKDAVATQDELAHVQIGISQQIGASISGLNANSIQNILVGGGDVTQAIQSTLKNTAAQTIAGLASESIMAEYGNSLNELIGNAFKNINSEDLQTSDLTDALNSIINDFDWDGMNAEASAAADAISEFTGEIGNVSVVLAKADYLSGLKKELAILEGNFDAAKSAYISRLEEEESLLEGKMNDAKSAYIDLLNDEASAQSKLASSLKSAIESIKGYRETLIGKSDAPAENKAYLQAKQASLASSVMSGNVDDTSKLIDISGKYLKVSQQTSKTSLDYRREVAKTNALLFRVQDNLKEQLTDAEIQARAFKDLISSVKGVDEQVLTLAQAEAEYNEAKAEFDNNQFTTELEQFEEIKSFEEVKAAYYAAKEALDNNWYEAEIAALKDIELSILDLRDAFIKAGGISTYNPTITPGISDPVAQTSMGTDILNAVQAGTGTQLNDLLQGTISTRLQQMVENGTASGLAEAIAISAASSQVRESGSSISDISDMIKNVPGFASGGYHSGCLAFTGEQGVELSYWPPSQIMSNSDMMTELSNKEVVKKLNELVDAVNKGNYAIAKNTQESAKTLKKFDYDGMPEVRT